LEFFLPEGGKNTKRWVRRKQMSEWSITGKAKARTGSSARREGSTASTCGRAWKANSC